LNKSEDAKRQERERIIGIIELEIRRNLGNCLCPPNFEECECMYKDKVDALEEVIIKIKEGQNECN
jgi:hypothetical protein